MIKVYEANNIVDAQLVCDWLRDDDISANIHGSYLSGAAGELPAGTTISIWIHDPIYKLRALDIVEAFETERKKPVKTLTCSNCSEQVEGNYSVCWNCGTVFDET